MGCDLSIALVMEHKEDADALHARMLAAARSYDAQFSRFIEESELSKLNRERATEVSAECLAVLMLGRELYRKTDGAFNPLVDISRFGYDADIEEVRGAERVGKGVTSPYDIDFSRVHINATEQTVTLAEGQHIDVGGYLKGYAAERLAALAPQTAGVIVNVGGDIYTRGMDVEGQPFQFEIERPESDEAAATFTYADGSIATSGTYKRRWIRAGTPFHHILDASGRRNPATDIVSATVLGKRGHEAEAYATAALVLGSENAATLLRARGMEFCFIRADGSLIPSPGFSARVTG